MKKSKSCDLFFRVSYKIFSHDEIHGRNSYPNWWEKNLRLTGNACLLKQSDDPFVMSRTMTILFNCYSSIFFTTRWEIENFPQSQKFTNSLNKSSVKLNKYQILWFARVLSFVTRVSLIARWQNAKGRLKINKIMIVIASHRPSSHHITSHTLLHPSSS